MNLRGVLLGRARALRNSLFGRRGARGPLVSLALLGLAAAIAHAGLAALFGALARAGATPAELRAALALLLDLALLGLLLFDLESVVATLILDRDLDLLRRSPLAPAAILGLKLLDALPRTALPLVVLALPALLAYAAVGAVPPAAWLAAPVVAALLWAIPLGAGVALTLALLARVPARRAREALGLVSSVAFAGLWLVNLLLVPRLAAAEGEPLDRVRALLSAAGEVLAWTPGGWAATLLGAEAPAAAARAALALSAAAAASAALAALAAGRHLAPLLGAARTPARRARPRAGAGARAHRGPFVLTVMGRDTKLFVRDWTVLGDVLTAALLWTLLPLVALPVRPLDSPALVRAMLLTLSVGLGYEIGARAIPLERRGAEWMRLAPIPARRWAAARLASAGGIALALVAVAGLSLGLSAGLAPLDWLALVATVVPAVALAVALGLWTGAAFRDPDWTSARVVLTLGGRLVAASLVVIQVAAWLAVTVYEQSIPTEHSLWVILFPSSAAVGLTLLAVAGISSQVNRLGYNR